MNKQQKVNNTKSLIWKKTNKMYYCESISTLIYQRPFCDGYFINTIYLNLENQIQNRLGNFGCFENHKEAKTFVEQYFI